MVTGETFCLVLCPAHPVSCIVPHDVFEWSTPTVSSSSDRVSDHLTVGRNLHMKDAGTITSHPGGASDFRKPRWRDRHMVSNRGHCAVVNILVRVGSVGTTPANHCTRPILAQGFELWGIIERLAEKGWMGGNKTPSDKGEHGWIGKREKNVTQILAHPAMKCARLRHVIRSPR